MCVYFPGPLVSIFVAATSTRVTMVTGGVILTVSCFVSYFVTSIDGLIVTYGLIGGKCYHFLFKLRRRNNQKYIVYIDCQPSSENLFKSLKKF